jgi:hypothetical protein
MQEVELAPLVHHRRRLARSARIGYDGQPASLIWIPYVAMFIPPCSALLDHSLEHG